VESERWEREGAMCGSEGAVEQGEEGGDPRASMASFHRRRADGAVGGQRDLAGEISAGGGRGWGGGCRGSGRGGGDCGRGTQRAKFSARGRRLGEGARRQNTRVWTPTVDAYRVVEMRETF
jgi:hypothetical protein